MPSLDFGEMMGAAFARGQEVMAKPPESAEEAILRLLVINLKLWDQGTEPVAAAFDKCAEFLSDKSDPLYQGQPLVKRVGISQLIHQMRKARNKAHAQSARATPIEQPAVDPALGSGTP